MSEDTLKLAKNGIQSNGNEKKSRILQALETDDVIAYFDDALENQLVLNMGPQHPATHGVLRLLDSLDGETIVNTIPDLGNLHRGYEKLAENMTFHDYIPHTDRPNYLSPPATNVCYVVVAKQIRNIEITERAKNIR